MDGLRTLLAGRYRLGEVLGRGGMSTVYRAEDETLGRTVAVKVLSAALAEDDPVWVARFEREARAAASLNHPGVATIYDTGVEDGIRFIVMECVRGESLAAILRERAPLGPERAVHIGAQVADVLAAAHAAGIVHRDVKPGNVMVGPGDAVKVLDFGIARAVGGTALTQTVSVIGTAAYMAPEQAAGAMADARSDIYSLGCLLYAMLAGAPPFTGELAAAVMHQHVNVAPRPLHEVASGVPPALAALVAQMLAKDPDARPESAREVRDRLQAALDPTAPTAMLGGEALAAGVGAGAAGAGLAGAGARAGPTGPTPGAGRTARPAEPTAATRPAYQRARPTRNRRLPAILAVALLAAVIAAVAIASAGGGSSSSSSTHSTPPPTSTHATSSTTTPSTTTPSSTTTPPTSTAPPAKKEPKAKKPKPPGHGGEPPGQAKKKGGPAGGPGATGGVGVGGG